MKEIIIDGNKVEISDERAEELKKEFIKPKAWKPQNGEEYYYLDGSGFISRFLWRGKLDEMDFAFNQGNVFQTLEEAEFERDKRELLHEIKIWREENDVTGFADSDLNHYTLTYFWSDDEISCTGHFGVEYANGIHFKTEALAEKFLKDFDHDRLKKYLF